MLFIYLCTRVLPLVLAQLYISSVNSYSAVIALKYCIQYKVTCITVTAGALIT